MNKEIAKFIEQNINSIENNNWHNVYETANDKILGEVNISTTELSKTLLEASINPLPYLGYVPNFYLWGQTIKFGWLVGVKEARSIGINSFSNCKNLGNIELDCKIIQRHSFFDSDVQMVKINNNCRIDMSAFMNCKRLKTIYLPNQFTLGFKSFSGTSDDLEFIYDGVKSGCEGIKELESQGRKITYLK